VVDWVDLGNGAENVRVDVGNGAENVR